MSSTSQSPQSSAQGASLPTVGHIVGRGMLALVFSQLVTTPISIVVQALIARRLGAGPFGAIYFATATLGVWYLLVEWGGHSEVSARVARDRTAGARLFASGMVVRMVFATIVVVATPVFASWMEYDQDVQLAFALVSLKLAFQGLGALCLAIVRGFERVPWQAGSAVFGSAAEATLVIAALLAGGGLREVLVAQVVAASLTLVLQLGFVIRLKLGPWLPDVATMKSLLKGGFSFLVLDFVVRLQPFVDATFLDYLASPESLGWHSAASRIAGVLVFPALTLNFALYPTLVRLWSTDRHQFDALVRQGLRTVAVLGVLAGTGTALFAPWVIQWIYGEAFAPAALSLSVMSLFVLLVYGSIVLGPAIAAAGRQWLWCGAQSLCLIVSAVLDPVLIPWTQRAYGNGSIGVSISVGLAEIAMLSLGLLILPKGVVTRTLGRSFVRCAVAAACTAVVGLVLREYPILAIPMAVATYLATLWVLRELDEDLLMLAPPWLGRLLRPIVRRASTSSTRA